ncbi:MAG: 5'-3' exonuclease H3TH domain-containing protein [Mycobacteriales bacterium]|nr:5'-3' exonuclease H3TH domain-containing protein [Mycobacteriales bacterium]
MPGQLTLLDAPSLWYRSFYGVPDSITAPDGTPVNLVRGTIDLIGRIVKDTRPARLVAALDLDWRPAFRVVAVPSYKAHRVAAAGGEEEPPSLTVQVPILLEVLDALGVCVVGAEGHEADDVLGTLSTRDAGPVDVVTGDRDLFQLVDDSRGVRVLYTVEKLKPYDEAAVTAKYGIAGRSYAEFAVLRGDPSDGLPGVKGVGEKTAAALVNRFHTVDAIIEALDAGSDDGFPAGTRNKLEAARDYLAVAPAVSRTVRDLPIPDLDDALPRTPREPDRLLALSDRWGLESSLERFLQACEVAHSA